MSGRVRTYVLYALPLVLALVYAAPVAATGVPYVLLQGVDSSLNDYRLEDDRVSAYTIRVSWRKLHEEGFGWLDEQMARADEFDLDVQLRVMGGTNAPLNLPGVSYFSWADGAVTDTAPVPWDPQLVDHWATMAARLGDRYADNPRLTQIHIPGFAGSSEMHTPAEITEVAGYSSQALAEAWVDFSRPLIEAFPDADIALNYTTPSQANLSGTDSDGVIDELIDIAGDRMGFQANDLAADLDPTRNKYQTLLDLKQAGHSVGFQMVSVSSQDRFGGEFAEAVAHGLSFGAEWLEFYAVDTEFIPTAGDYNYDGVVNLADYTVWRDNLGGTIDLRADGSGNQQVDAADFAVWKQGMRTNSGSLATPSSSAVPEPSTLAIAGLVASGYLLTLKLRRRGR
jgi:hypothetical protein